MQGISLGGDSIVYRCTHIVLDDQGQPRGATWLQGVQRAAGAGAAVTSGEGYAGIGTGEQYAAASGGKAQTEGAVCGLIIWLLELGSGYFAHVDPAGGQAG